jgi:hypothetical protein
MSKAIGFVIVLYALSHYFGQAMTDLGRAASATFTTIEVAALKSQQKLSEI